MIWWFTCECDILFMVLIIYFLSSSFVLFYMLQFKGGHAEYSQYYKCKV